MTLDQTLNQLHRHFTRLWNGEKGAKHASTLSYNEYEYLRCVEQLDGAKLPHLVQDDAQGTHLSELAHALHVAKASASVMFNKLEKKGWVQRFPCQFDARAQHILLTDQGRRLLQQEQQVYQQMATQIQARLTPKEYQTFEQLLAKICGQL